MTERLIDQDAAKGISLYSLDANEDNLIYIVTWGDNNAFIVDPGESQVCLEFLARHNLNLKKILITHGHADHIDGVEKLQKETGCKVVAPPACNGLHIDMEVGDGEECILGPFFMNIYATPGHCPEHIVYYIPDFKWLFCGDVLFGAGCGKIIQGSIDQLYHSVLLLTHFPPKTQVLCGHNYVEKNLKFALSLDPNNQEMMERLLRLQNGKEPAVPSTLEIEFLTNPFLRLNAKSMLTHLGMESCTPKQVFAHIRQLKDHFEQ